MNYQEVLAHAKETIGPRCKVCPNCNGLACGHQMPGPGSKPPGNGAYDNWKAWREIKLNMDTIVADGTVDTSFSLFGEQFALPLLTGPIGSLRLQYNPTDDIRDYNTCCMEACRDSGIIATFGDGLDPTVVPMALADAARCGNRAIPVLNPMSMETILANLEQVNQSGCFASSVVVDSAGLPHLKKFSADAGSKSVLQLRELKDFSQKPLIFKGIMNVKTAQKAVEAGADGIIVSNHGGRVLSDTPATAEVLPEIVAAVGGQTKIIVDGGIRSGLDMFKALAMGADAVMICRPVLIAYYGGKQEGICTYVEKLRQELADTMYMCGARSLSDINADMVRLPR